MSFEVDDGVMKMFSSCALEFSETDINEGINNSGENFSSGNEFDRTTTAAESIDEIIVHSNSYCGSLSKPGLLPETDDQAVYSLQMPIAMAFT